MPKSKAWGENSKAVEARTRKADAKKAEDDRRAKAIDDAYWQDDDNKQAKKQNRKDEQEKKRLDKLQRKTESKQLEQEESNQVVKPNQIQAKVTQAQIALEKEKREAAARKASATNKAPKPAPIVENLNHLNPVEEATTVDEALKLLSVNDAGAGSTPDRHPERRAKAAYNAFEEARLPILKAENPSLRLSQLKQMLFDEWKKSPENPLNMNHAQYNS